MLADKLQRKYVLLSSFHLDFVVFTMYAYTDLSQLPWPDQLSTEGECLL